MHKLATFACLTFFFYRFAFSFCDVIPQNMEEARSFLWDEIIDSICFNAAEILFLNPIDPISEGWSRLESIGFDLAIEDIPTNREIIAVGGDLQRLSRRYPLISQFENFIRISNRSLQRSPVHSTFSALVRRTHGDDMQFFSLSSVTRINNGLLVSLQARERSAQQYIESRSILYGFGNNRLFGFFNVGNLTSPGNELLFGRYAGFRQAEGADNFLFGSRGGFNGILTQVGTQNFGISGYFHIRQSEHLAGGGIFIQPKNFRLELKAIYAEKDTNTENLLQIRGVFGELGLSISNAVSLSSGKNALLIRYDRSARHLRIISQAYLLQEGFSSPFSSLIPRSDTNKNQILGSRLSLSGRAPGQRYSLSARLRLNGEVGTASIIGSYHLPEITGFGLRSNLSMRSDTVNLRQTHTVFNRKRIGRILQTNLSFAYSFDNFGWIRSVFDIGTDFYLPNNQVIFLGYSQRNRPQRTKQETIFLSYSSRGQARTMRSLSVDIPLYANARGLRINGEMRFAFPVFD